MEQRRTTRFEERPKKKFRMRTWVKVAVLLILACIAFIAVQFYQGKKIANEHPIAQESFEGDVQQGDVENILLLGVDTRGEEKSRTDTMMLVSWDKKNDTVKLVSFMRDIYAQIPGYQSYKLNTAYYLGGAQLAKDTISSMFNVDIHHYALIDFKNFEALIDILAPKGITIDVEKDMSENIGVTLTAGEQQLNGQELLGYARFRKDAEGDFGRVRRQQQVIEAVKEQALSITSLPKLPKFAGAAQGFVATDIGSFEQLTKVLAIAVSGVQVDKLTIPAEGTYSYASYAHAGSVIEINNEKNQQILHDFLDK